MNLGELSKLPEPQVSIHHKDMMLILVSVRVAPVRSGCDMLVCVTHNRYSNMLVFQIAFSKMLSLCNILRES
jgi:hypothetical protein